MENVKKQKYNNLSLIAGLTFLSFPTWILIIGGMFLLADICFNKYMVIYAFFLSLFSTFLITNNIKKTIISGLLLAITFVVSAWFSSKLYDTAFDSIGYHLRTVIAISEGWNPIYDSLNDLPIWSKHYAKGLEIIYSAIFSFSGNLESTKCINIILLIATLCISYNTLSVVTNLSVKAKFLILILLSCNTILINQLLSAMNDFVLWIETCWLICGFVLAMKKTTGIIPYIIISISLIFGINSKFTHFFFLGLGCLFFAFWCAYYKEYSIVKKGCLTVLFSIILGVCVIGYNPYVTNLIDYANPFYPLGSDKVDIMTGNTPEMLQGNSRITNFVKAFWSLDDKPWALIKADFSFKDLIDSYTVSKSRVNGFGAAMPLLLLLSFVLMIVIKPKLRWWIVYIFIFLLSFIFKEGWWARYMTFLWLNLILPIVLCLHYSKNKLSKLKKSIISIFSVVMISGALTSFSIMLATRIGYTHYLNYIFDQCRQNSYSPICVEMNNIHIQQFKQENIQYTEKHNVVIKEPYWFYIYGDGFFDAMIYLPENYFPKLYNEPDNLLDKLSMYNKRIYNPEI